VQIISSFKEFSESLLEFIRSHEMGGTGDSPVPSGHWPDGTGKTFELETDVRKDLSASSIPSGGSPLGTGQGPVLPGAAASDSQFNQLALSLFALQYSGVDPYRRFCEARKVSPKTVHHWSEIPALPTSAFKELEISSLKPEQRTHVFHSSGTTEQIPSRHFHNADSLATYEASLLRWFQKHFLADWEELAESEIIDPMDKPGCIFLTPSPALAPNSSLVHMFETVRRELGSRDSLFTGNLTRETGEIVGQASSLPKGLPAPVSQTHGQDAHPGRLEAYPTISNEPATGQVAWTLDIDQTLFALRKSMCANRPITILGTAFSFVHLLDHFAANNIRYRLAEGSRVLETGGYKGRSRSMPKTELHELITKHLGIPASHIVCEYGMSELSSQAYDGLVQSSKFKVQSPRAFQFPPWTRAQIISPETGLEVGEGETGLIRIFDLANVFSVLAIQTEDLGVRRGSGFELIARNPTVEPRGCSLMAP